MQLIHHTRQQSILGWGLFALLSLILATTGGSAMADASVKTKPQVSAQALVNGYAKRFDTLHAQFDQILQDESGKVLQRQSGTLVLDKPNRFNMHYATPKEEEQYLVSDGKQFWTYNVDFEEANVRPLDDSLSGTPLGLILNGQSVTDEYTVTDLEPVGENRLIRLDAKKEVLEATGQTGFALLVFDAKSELALIQMQDAMGQVVAIEFKNVEYNQPVSDKNFKLDLPKNVLITGAPAS